jgi:hypothetical protein
MECVIYIYKKMSCIKEINHFFLHLNLSSNEDHLLMILIHIDNPVNYPDPSHKTIYTLRINL